MTAGRRSAGLLLYRWADSGLQVLIGHMGGPLWARREAGAWTIPKGEYGADEDPLDAARREFAEELGLAAPEGRVIELGSVRQAGGKIVTAFAISGDVDPATIVPGMFGMQWPPKSGATQQFPELDRVQWVGPARAAEVLVAAQRAFIDRLENELRSER